MRINFPAVGVWQCRVEISQDGERDWKTFAEPGELKAKNQWTPIKITGSSMSGRYLRVTLLSWPTNGPAGIAELAVTGTTSSR